MKSMVTFIIASMVMVLSGSVSAQSMWPTSLNWVGYTLSNSNAIQDPQDVPNNQIEFDLVYDAYAPYSVMVAASLSHVYFRLQVRNITTWTVGTYILFIADNNGTILGKTYLTLTGNAGSIHVENAAKTIDQTTGSGSHASNIGGMARFYSIGGSSTHEYVEFQVPRSTFESVLGITNGQI